MDPATAAADIADRLSASFSSVADIKANLGRLSGADRGPAESGGGIITLSTTSRCWPARAS